MVFFICNACGETLKRNKVEIHYKTKCRNCDVLSCVDCSKEFWGDDYKKHLTCISEEEKYSGSNYIAKPNKGEVKQELWQTSIQDAVEKHKKNPKLKDLLTRLIEHPNIPRKKKKFENFMRSSFGVRDNYCIAQIWEIIAQTTSNGEEENKTETNGNNSDRQAENTNIENNDSEIVKKLSKRDKKEQRKQQNDKKEKKDKYKNGVENMEKNLELKKNKKKRKRKHEDSDDDVDEPEINHEKRKREDTEDDVEEESEEEKPVKKRKIKFDWEKVIVDLLKTKGEEIPIKKLRKKVLAEYACQGGCIESEEELCAKFNKKVMKNPRFKVLKERVKLAKAR